MRYHPCVDGDDLPRLVAETEQAIADSEDLLKQLRDSERYVGEMIDALKKELADLRRSCPDTQKG